MYSFGLALQAPEWSRLRFPLSGYAMRLAAVPSVLLTRVHLHNSTPSL